MSFGKKSSNQSTTPQPVITQQPMAEQQPIERTARTAAAQDRLSQAQSASLLADSSEEETKRRQSSTLAPY